MPPVPRSCVCRSPPLWSCSSFAAVFMEPWCPSLCTNLFWTLRCRLEHLQPSLCCSVTPLLLSVLVQTAQSTSSAAAGRCSRISPSRGLVEGLVFLRALSVGDSCASHLRSFSTLLRRVAVVAVASLRLLQATHFVVASLPRECLAHFACSPGLRRLDVSSRARGTSFLSLMTCLACVAVPTKCPSRPGSCPPPCQWRIRP